MELKFYYSQKRTRKIVSFFFIFSTKAEFTFWNITFYSNGIRQSSVNYIIINLRIRFASIHSLKWVTRNYRRIMIFTRQLSLLRQCSCKNNISFHCTVNYCILYSAMAAVRRSNYFMTYIIHNYFLHIFFLAHATNDFFLLSEISKVDRSQWEYYLRLFFYFSFLFFAISLENSCLNYLRLVWRIL